MSRHFYVPVWLTLRLVTGVVTVTVALWTGTALASVTAQGTPTLSATIERDIWGVPHVHGATDPDAAFGLGYAMAEDTYRVIESSIPYYRGTAGRFFGPDAARRDYLVHWLGL